MKTEHTVIRCGPEHSGQIRAIYNEAIINTTALYEYEPRSAAVMEKWYADKQAAELPVFGIECEDGEGRALAGFATWGPFRQYPAYRFSVEHSVYVDVRFRRRGIGRRLLETLIEEASARGLHMLIAGIDASNAPSIALHSAGGFSHCGTVRGAGFKFGRWLDLEFWQLVLESGAS